MFEWVARLRNRPAVAAADPGCPECGGAGGRLSTLNPQGRLDYWIELDGSDGEWLFPADAAEPATGMSAATVSNILRMLDEGQPETPAAIVTPDLQWVGETNESLSVWPDEAYAVLKRYDDCVAVVVDCHC